jgi:NADH-quinone oxidoreductase subunit L
VLFRSHAGFKALLFLCSGVFIHACGGNDMFEIGRRGGRHLKIPMICMIIAAAALSGIPPFSGFFSKELILAALAGQPNPIWLAAGLMGAFLTTYYTFRLIFIILLPRGEAQAHAAGHHAAAGYWVMAAPLVILAAVTGVLGFGEQTLGRFLLQGFPGPVPGAGHDTWLPFAALGLAAAAVGLAWFEFGRRGADQVGFVERVAPLRELFSRRWYIDDAYRWLLDNVLYRVFSALCAKNDRNVIDGAVDGLGGALAAAGRILAMVHTGSIQVRLLVVSVVVVLLGLYYFV